MQAKDIEMHISSYKEEIEEALSKHRSASAKLSMAQNPEEEEIKNAASCGSGASEIQTVPLCPKALVHDVV